MIENSERRLKNFIKRTHMQKHSNQIFSSHALTFCLASTNFVLVLILTFHRTVKARKE